MSRPKRSAALLALGLAACGSRPAATAAPGQPAPGLSTAERARFAAGEALFNTVFGPERGLGPAFNENQCSACHTSPASGGVGGERVLRATRFDPATGCDLLSGEGGENIRRKLTLAARTLGVMPESVPAGGTAGRFTAPALYGIGFVDAIPDATLLAHADSADRDGDGISGRVGRTRAGRPARFGRKADVARLAEFVVAAAHQEMGLTTLAHPADALRGKPAPPGLDPAADPELGEASVALLTAYVRFLAPLGRGAPPRPWSAASVERGERWFGAIGCARCHVPALETGRDSSAALNRRRIQLYSDLLLHDLGPELADVCGPGAAPAELRTESLMGLRYRDLLLHDGRATDIRGAIRWHGGEAAAARREFERSTAAQQEELIAFLATL